MSETTSTDRSRATRLEGLTGHRPLKLGIGPFATTVPALLAAVAWFAVAVVWGVHGGLPGGRWLVVHLVTLGVLTNLLIGFSQHFAHAVTKALRPLGQLVLVPLNLGVLAVMGGMVADVLWLLAAGASTIVAVVVLARLQLGRMRRAAPSARFGWVVSSYERAHEALIAGAVLGAGLGAGLVPGDWYLAVRSAHLHLNVLGWTGLVVLPTVLFFAPAMLRIRIPDGAEQRAARALRVGAAALLAAVLLLLVPTADGLVGAVQRLAAVTALAVYAWPVLSVTRSVVAMARAAHPCAARWLAPGAMAWLSLAVVADVAVVVTGAGRFEPAVGIAIGVGALLQLVLSVGLYLVPSLRGRGFATRDALIARTEQAAALRGVVLNAAVAVIVLATTPVQLPAPLVPVAWAVVLAVVAQALVLAVLPVRPDPTRARSSVARRYRASASG